MMTSMKKKNKEEEDDEEVKMMQMRRSLREYLMEEKKLLKFFLSLHLQNWKDSFYPLFHLSIFISIFIGNKFGKRKSVFHYKVK